jgi:hypothetical protein
MRTIIFLLANIITLLFFSCGYEQATQATKKYDLKTILNDSNWVEVLDTISFNIECLDADKMAEKYVIRDTSEYKILYDAIWSGDIYEKCQEYELPFINFERYSLLGLLTLTGPCKIKRMIFINDIEKKYFYQIEITITSLEKILFTNQNWLLVPKIKSEYEIIFDTTMKYYN